MTGINFPGPLADPNAPVWNMLAGAGIDLDLVTVDPAGDWGVISGSKRIAFGGATTETGDTAPGWDWATYELTDGEDETAEQGHAATDEELTDVIKAAIAWPADKPPQS